MDPLLAAALSICLAHVSKTGPTLYEPAFEQPCQTLIAQAMKNAPNVKAQRDAVDLTTVNAAIVAEKK